jgi:hypothetical protein
MNEQQLAAVKQALAALEGADQIDVDMDKAIAALQSIISQEPQPVPVKTYHDGKPWPVQPKPWVGLTKEDKEDFWTADQMTNEEWEQLFAKIENRLKEKNRDH